MILIKIAHEITARFFASTRDDDELQRLLQDREALARCLPGVFLFRKSCMYVNRMLVTFAPEENAHQETQVR